MRRLRRPAPIDTAIDWGRQLADALTYLHRQGVVHRDLKPENILVTTGRPLDHRRLRHRDACRCPPPTWKHLAESLGTPDYMSPEQVQGERGDVRSDIYSWGVMMYELLTGRVPFEGDNWMAVMAGTWARQPEAIHKLRHDVPPALEAVVMHAMRRHPDQPLPVGDGPARRFGASTSSTPRPTT